MKRGIANMTVEKVYQVIFIDVVNTSIEHAGSHV